MKTRIYYHHTDCGGVVYYGRYLEFLEEARTEAMEECSLFIKDLTKEGIFFVVARQEMDYKFPSFYGDILESKARISKVSGVRMEFEQEIKNQNGQIVVLGKTILVCVDKNLKPQAIPDTLMRKLS